jgi:ComF family protein
VRAAGGGRSPGTDGPRWLREALRLGHRLLDVAYPPLCLHCGERLDEAPAGAPPALCRPCREDCVPVRELACARCGLPARSAREVDEGPCAECAEVPPPYAVARSAFLYRESGPLRSVLLRLKHAADATVAGELAAALAAPAREAALRLQRPALAAVPLHWLRRWRRGYNQAELLARELGRRLALRVEAPLARPRRTLPQKGGRAQRLTSLAGAFALRRGARVAGRDFLLVDDVLTTGATVSECARVLLGAGARAVGAVTVARADKSR